MGIGNIADTGMQAAMANMEVISNNIANSKTFGFKRGYINFADLYPSANNASGNQIGLGVQIASIDQDFTSTGYEYTGIGTDLSIVNSGFFVLKDPNSGQISYTRNGRFHLGNDGFLYNIFNQRVQGYPAINGSVPSGGSVTDLPLTNLTMPAQASTTATINTNLNSTDTNVPALPFDPTNTATFNYTTTTTIYDSLGNTHNLQLFYIRTSPVDSNTWTVNALVDGTSVSSTGQMVFSSTGVLSSSSGLTGLSFTPTNGAAPMTFNVDVSGSTQVANPYIVIGDPTTDGFTAGTFNGNFSIDQNGFVNMSYSNGKTQQAGQIAVAEFTSVQGLTDIGNMQWIASTASGPASLSQSNSTNNIYTNQLEESNVDLTTEMVDLIGAQQAFQANAQVEQVYNEIMQTIIQL